MESLIPATSSPCFLDAQGKGVHLFDHEFCTMIGLNSFSRVVGLGLTLCMLMSETDK